MMTPAAPWWSTRSFAAAMIVAAMVPLLWPVIPPLVDLPGHMGRYAVEIAPADSPLHRWFHFEWAMIGNLGVDLLVIPLAKLFGLELAVKLVAIAIPALTVAGMLLVAREAHGEIPATAALALPLAYGYPFQFGFVNFALSMALALFGFALWLRLGRTGRLKLRALLFVPYGIILWFAHSFGWGVLGLLAFAAELDREHRAGKSWVYSIRDAALAVVPLVPPVALMLLWRSGHVSGMTGDWFNWTIKTYYLRSTLRSDGTLFDRISGEALLFLALAGLFGLGFRRNRLLLIAGLILLATYILLPRIALGSAYADMRLAPYMLAVLLLALVPATSNRKFNGFIAAAAVAFFLVRIGAHTQTYLRVDKGYRAQLEALDHLPRGVRVFALTNLQCLSKPYSTRLDHIEAMTMVRREAFSNGQWAMAGAQLLRLDFPGAEGYADDPSQILRPGRCNQPGSHRYPAVLSAFPRDRFDYVWLINFAPAERPQGDMGLESVWQGPMGALYRIRKTPSGG